MLKPGPFSLTLFTGYEAKIVWKSAHKNIYCYLSTSSLSGFEISAMQFLYYTLMTWWPCLLRCCHLQLPVCTWHISAVWRLLTHKDKQKTRRCIFCGFWFTSNTIMWLKESHPISPTDSSRCWIKNPPESSSALHWDGISHPGLELLLAFMVLLNTCSKFYSESKKL